MKNNKIFITTFIPHQTPRKRKFLNWKGKLLHIVQTMNGKYFRSI